MGSKDDVAFLRPIKVGDYQISHRIVLPPLTRCRALNTVPTQSMAVYYAQRTTSGGLLISEGTIISPDGYGWPHTPGIFTDEQVEAWKPITESVHKLGGIFFCQIWHCGRASHSVYQPNGNAPVSSTNNRLLLPWKAWLVDEQGEFSRGEFSTPRALTTQEIPRLVNDFRVAARNAIAAGFDGVEIHAAGGFLIDQFLKDGINDRTDEYGGSMENRCRFTLEVTRAVVEEIGAGRTGIRLAPKMNYNASTEDSDPMGLSVYLHDKLNELNLAYIHLFEVSESVATVDSWQEPLLADITKRIKCPVIVTGGHSRETGIKVLQSGYADLVGYGRLFVSNPDLVKRLSIGAPLNPPNYSTFYSPHQTLGYLDYPFLEDIMSSTEKAANHGLEVYAGDITSQ